MPGMEQIAFTHEDIKLLNRLITDVEIHGGGNSDHFNALWDTGATTTCISKGVAKRLGMTPTGKCGMSHASGFCPTNTYLASITLPNNVKIENIMVCEADLDSQGIGALIGMDIITKGDFAVTNRKGVTTFSFRVPSMETIDYVKKIEILNITGTHNNKKSKKKKK